MMEGSRDQALSWEENRKSVIEPEELANSKGEERGSCKLHHEGISRCGTGETEDTSKEITVKSLCCY
jgi:hypothetical protein